MKAQRCLIVGGGIAAVFDAGESELLAISQPLGVWCSQAEGGIVVHIGPLDIPVLAGLFTFMLANPRIQVYAGEGYEAGFFWTIEINRDELVGAIAVYRHELEKAAG